MGAIPPPTVARLDPEICVNPTRNMPGKMGGRGAPAVGRIKIKQKLKLTNCSVRHLKFTLFHDQKVKIIT